jgi:hypothetical protein
VFHCKCGGFGITFPGAGAHRPECGYMRTLRWRKQPRRILKSA